MPSSDGSTHTNADTGTTDPSRSSIAETAAAAPRGVDAVRATGAPPLAKGDVLGGRYTVLSLLGRGAHGWVLRGEHTHLRYPVAIKVLDVHASENATLRARFRREIILGARLRSEHLAPVVDSGETASGLAYLVMELVDGPTLALALRDGPLGPDATVDLGLQLAEAVSALAAEDVVHRDIKPENIVLRRAASGRVIAKLVDLGISHLAVDDEEDARDLHLTDTNLVVGTPLYMAPEQLSSDELDARTDLYALSAVMFECLTGAPPHTGASPAAVLARAIAADRPPLTGFAPPELAAIVDRGLEHDPSRRWPSPEALIDALDQVRRTMRRRGAAWADVPLSPYSPPDLPSMQEQLRSADVDPFTPPRRRVRAAWIGPVALIALLLVIAVTTVTSLFLDPGQPASGDQHERSNVGSSSP